MCVCACVSSYVCAIICVSAWGSVVYILLSPDDDTLVPLPSFHEVVGIVCNGKNVGRLFSYLLVTILLDVGSVIDREELVGIDGYQD